MNTIAMGITVVRDDCDAQVWTEATKEALVMVRAFSRTYRAYRMLFLTVYCKALIYSFFVMRMKYQILNFYYILM